MLYTVPRHENKGMDFACRGVRYVRIGFRHVPSPSARARLERIGLIASAAIVRRPQLQIQRLVLAVHDLRDDRPCHPPHHLPVEHVKGDCSIMYSADGVLGLGGDGGV